MGSSNLGDAMREIRSKAFAGFELLLDLMHELRLGLKLDMESIIIMACINEATIRPILLDPKTPESVKGMAVVPEQYRGSISMLLVAERVNLPRETVRRRIKTLIRDGYVLEDDKGRVRPTPGLMRPEHQRIVRESFSAVKRYDKRLRELGLVGISGGVSRKS